MEACHKGDRLLLTVACPAGPQNYEKMHLKAMDKHLDFWNLMAYDYAGSWDSHAGHQANLYPSKSDPQSTPFSTSIAVEYYTSHGVHPSKLVLGLPLVCLFRIFSFPPLYGLLIFWIVFLEQMEDLKAPGTCRSSVDNALTGYNADSENSIVWPRFCKYRRTRETIFGYWRR